MPKKSKGPTKQKSAVKAKRAAIKKHSFRSGYPDRVREHPAGTVLAAMKPVAPATVAEPLFFDVARQRPMATIEEPSTEQMFRASLHAFWRLAAIFRLTIAERAKLLGVSERTSQRWEQTTPEPDVNTLDRLQLILRTYQHLCELAPVTEAEQAHVFRSEGSAEDAEHPERSLLDALAVPSILEMYANALRFAALTHAV